MIVKCSLFPLFVSSIAHETKYLLGPGATKQSSGNSQKWAGLTTCIVCDSPALFNMVY